ncbi:hypothetical protein [Actinoplanes ovalisporus]
MGPFGGFGVNLALLDAAELATPSRRKPRWTRRSRPTSRPRSPGPRLPPASSTWPLAGSSASRAR